MTQLPVCATTDTFETSLEYARNLTMLPLPTDRYGLHAPLDADSIGLLNRMWERIELALRNGFHWGAEATRDAWNAAVAGVEDLLAGAELKAAALRDALIERVRVFIRTFIEGTVGQLPALLALPGAEYALSTVKCTYKIALAGSVKANLQEAFSLVTEGTLEVGTEYTRSAIDKSK